MISTYIFEANAVSLTFQLLTLFCFFRSSLHTISLTRVRSKILKIGSISSKRHSMVAICPSSFYWETKSTSITCRQSSRTCTKSLRHNIRWSNTTSVPKQAIRSILYSCRRLLTLRVSLWLSQYLITCKRQSKPRSWTMKVETNQSRLQLNPNNRQSHNLLPLQSWKILKRNVHALSFEKPKPI